MDMLLNYSQVFVVIRNGDHFVGYAFHGYQCWEVLRPILVSRPNWLGPGLGL